MTKRLVLFVGVLLLGFGVSSAGAGSARATDDGSLFPHPVKAFKGDQCVEPVDVMRRNHWKYLKHQRDETVRQGIRGAKYSLRQCIECHAVPDKEAGGARTVRVFCGECHKFAAVNIDCFQCHTTKPENVKSSDAMPTGPLPPGHPTMNKAASGRDVPWTRKTPLADLGQVQKEGSPCDVRLQ